MSASRGATVECSCATCRKRFVARVADRKRGWARFCSKSCKAIKQERATHQFRDMLRDGLDPDHYRGMTPQERMHHQAMEEAEMGWDAHKGEWSGHD